MPIGIAQPEAPPVAPVRSPVPADAATQPGPTVAPQEVAGAGLAGAKQTPTGIGIENTVSHTAERAPIVQPETAAEPSSRSNDAAAAIKAGADAMQHLGFPAQAGQAAAAATAQSTAAAAAAASAAPAAAPVPVAGLAIEIAAQAHAGNKSFEIRLDPPELGRIDVRLEIDRDGHVTSRMIVERSETLDLLKRDAPQLERALQQAGLKTADSALEFSLRHHAPQRQDDEISQNATHLIATEDGAPSLDAVRQNYGRRFGRGNGIDILV